MALAFLGDDEMSLIGISKATGFGEFITLDCTGWLRKKCFCLNLIISDVNAPYKPKKIRVFL